MDENNRSLFYNNLTDEQKAKAKKCRNVDEFMDFTKKEGIELPDELLDQVAGGGFVETMKEFWQWLTNPRK